MSPRFPSLYEINTRVWLAEWSRKLGRRATFDLVPDAEFDRWAEMGFDWVWLMGVWQTGTAGKVLALALPELHTEYRHTLPDLALVDIGSSPFAIQEYKVQRELGGELALSRLRDKLAQRGIKLMLDFVPNHTALDHPWAHAHPEYFIRGSDADLEQDPQNFRRLDTVHGPQVFAQGKDPYFPSWRDTLQLNYRHPGLCRAMLQELQKIAGMCDGVRCDMAMLLLPEVIEKTWHARALPRDGSPPVEHCFWQDAIPLVRHKSPGFLFLAEVYWNKDRTLQEFGFDFTYDKNLYDKLRDRRVHEVREQLRLPLSLQTRCARFLENHDEQRAAHTFADDLHPAAALLTYLVPGLRFFHEGQFEGRQVRVPVQLLRRPVERINPALQAFYEKLLQWLKRPELREGTWRQWETQPAWEGNLSHQQLIAFTWSTAGVAAVSSPPLSPPPLSSPSVLTDVARNTQDAVDAGVSPPVSWPKLLVVVNYGPAPAQGYVPLPNITWPDTTVLLHDLTTGTDYPRQADELNKHGLYVDLPAWSAHVLDVQVH